MPIRKGRGLINKAIIIGNLTKDPKMSTTQSGVVKAELTVAVQRRFANSQGVREADFIRCVAWRQTAEFIGKYFQKGKKIGLVGSIQTRSYDDQQGVKQYVTEVVVQEVEFVTPNDNKQSAQAEPEAKPTEMTEYYDDETPF